MPRAWARRWAPCASSRRPTASRSIRSSPASRRGCTASTCTRSRPADPAEQNGAPVAALAAGGHYDPANTKKHGEPWGDGHLGDLPALYVAADGSANNPVLAPRMKQLADVNGRSIMVHAGGDNHADHPAPLGGGGARVACGVIGG